MITCFKGNIIGAEYTYVPFKRLVYRIQMQFNILITFLQRSVYCT